jgi:hypothetical protein
LQEFLQKVFLFVFKRNVKQRLKNFSLSNNIIIFITYICNM